MRHIRYLRGIGSEGAELTEIMPDPASARVLIVDDDDGLRRVYKRYLSEEGFRVAEAGSAEQALGLAESPDVILLDIRMPATDVRRLMESLQERHPSAKILVFSCHDLRAQKELLQGAEHYFDKADGCEALVSKLRTMLS